MWVAPTLAVSTHCLEKMKVFRMTFNYHDLTAMITQEGSLAKYFQSSYFEEEKPVYCYNMLHLFKKTFAQNNF